MLVKCKSCGLDRVLPSRYKSKFKENNWETNFACYMLKFREIFCDDDSYKFKEFDCYDYE